MNISDSGLGQIKFEEGFVSRPYKDAVGVVTQGYGHTNRAGTPGIPPVVLGGKPWTQSYATFVLQKDVGHICEPYVNRAMGVCKQNEFDAGCSFAYNLGGGTLLKASWVKFWKAHDAVNTKTALLSWSKAGGRVLSGLLARRNREFNLLWYGTYDPHAVPTPNVPHVDDFNVLSAEEWAKQVLQPDDILGIQRYLRDIGLLKDDDIDGIYGPGTVQAVKSFQFAHPDLVTDGKCGKATLAQLQRQAAMKEAAAGAAVVPTVGSAATAGLAGFGIAPDAMFWLTMFVIGIGLTVIVSVWYAYQNDFMAWVRLSEARKVKS